jgi:hypothetical protein
MGTSSGRIGGPLPEIPAPRRARSTKRRTRSTGTKRDARRFGAGTTAKGNDMKTFVRALGTAGLLALAACGGNADDKAAENISEMTENKADALEAQADNMTGAAEDQLEDKADQVREAGEDAADKADDNDDARVENQVANQVNGM